MRSSCFIWPEASDCAFAIRDDDISYFTEPRKLETIYEDAWKMGFKTSFAVIPYIRATNNLNVPPQFRGNLKYYLIRENEELTSYLKSRITDGKVDILQHGFCHTENPHLPALKFDLNEGKLVSHEQPNVDLKKFSEFYGLNKNECCKRVVEGKRILEEAFNVNVKVFVPPQEYLSKNLWECLKEEGLYVLGFNLHAIPFKDLNLFKLLVLAFRKFVKKEVYPEDLFFISKVPCLVSSYKHYWNKFINERVAEYWFKKVKEDFQNCLKRKGVFILHTHYWEYFYDWQNEPSQIKMLEYLYRILEYVNQFNIWKCSITELFDILNYTNVAT
jgi:predicted deacetylase